MNAAIKIDITKCPVPRLEPTRPARVVNKSMIDYSTHQEPQTKVPPATGRRPWLWTPERDKVLIQMYKQMKSDEEIADEFGFVPEQIRSRVSQLRRPGGPLHDLPTRGGKGKYWTEEQIATLIEMCEADIASSVISEKLGRSRGAIDTKIFELRRDGKISCRRSFGKKS